MVRRSNFDQSSKARDPVGVFVSLNTKLSAFVFAAVFKLDRTEGLALSNSGSGCIFTRRRIVFCFLFRSSVISDGRWEKYVLCYSVCVSVSTCKCL